MSRAYKIKVKESARRLLRARDQVSTQLELLEILPSQRMADLLSNELQRRGFQKQSADVLRRTQDGIVIEINTTTATVTARVEIEQSVLVEGERQAWTEARGAQAQKEERKYRDELQKDLQRQTDEQRTKLQTQVTDQLERHLADLQKELDQAVNRVTAEALKEKAAQLGHIKELTEDAATGALTIVLEV
jgi:hypothetical protein